MKENDEEYEEGRHLARLLRAMVVNDIHIELNRQNIDFKKFAEIMKVNESYVKKLMNEKIDITLEVLAKVTLALNARITIHIGPG